MSEAQASKPLSDDLINRIAVSGDRKALEMLTDDELERVRQRSIRIERREKLAKINKVTASPEELKQWKLGHPPKKATSSSVIKAWANFPNNAMKRGLEIPNDVHEFFFPQLATEPTPDRKLVTDSSLWDVITKPEVRAAHQREQERSFVEIEKTNKELGAVIKKSAEVFGSMFVLGSPENSLVWELLNTLAVEEFRIKANLALRPDKQVLEETGDFAWNAIDIGLGAAMAKHGIKGVRAWSKTAKIEDASEVIEKVADVAIDHAKKAKDFTTDWGPVQAAQNTLETYGGRMEKFATDAKALGDDELAKKFRSIQDTADSMYDKVAKASSETKAARKATEDLIEAQKDLSKAKKGKGKRAPKAKEPAEDLYAQVPRQERPISAPKLPERTPEMSLLAADQPGHIPKGAGEEFVRADAARVGKKAPVGLKEQEPIGFFSETTSGGSSPIERAASGDLPTGHGLPSHEMGKIKKDLLERMAGTNLGAAISAAWLADADNRDPFSIAVGLIPTILGFSAPEIRRAQRAGAASKVGKAAPGAGTLLSGNTDFGRLWVQRIANLFPDKLVPFTSINKHAARYAPVAGGVAAGAVAANPKDEDASLGVKLTRGLVVGGLAHGGLRGFARGLGSHIEGSFNPRRTVLRALSEGGGLEPEAQVFRAKYFNDKGGRGREISDTVNDLRIPLRDALMGKRGETIDAIDAYMRGAQSLDTVPKKYQNAALRARYLFDELGMDTVILGMAGVDYDLRVISSLGEYQPLQLLMDESGSNLLKVDRWIQKAGIDLKKVSARDYAKHSKLRDAPQDVRDALDEIHNTAYLLNKRGIVTNSDLAARRYQIAINSITDQTIPAAAIKRAKAFEDAAKKGETFEDLIEGTAEAENKVDLFRRGHGRHEAEMARYKDKIYRRLPDNKGAYGPLSGKYVDENTAFDMLTMRELPNTLLRWATRLFKTTHVPLNPSTQFRNITTQFFMNHIGDGPSPWRIWEYTNGIDDVVHRTDLYKQARRDNLFGGEYPNVELGGLTKQMMSLTSEESAMTGFMKYLDKGLKGIEKATKPAAWVTEKGTKLYESVEVANKMIVYRHAVKKLGMSSEDAVRLAKRTAFDYNEVPGWVKWSRNSPFGAPFVSFSYKALPRMLEASIALGDPKKLMRFWSVPMGLAAFNEYSSRTWGNIDNSEKGFFPTLKRTALNGLGIATGTGPIGGDTIFNWAKADYVGEQQVLLPKEMFGLSFRDAYDSPQHLDATYNLPWGDIGEVGKGNIGRALAKIGIPGAGMFPRQLEPSNPLIQIPASFIGGGKDAFTGKDIITPGADPIEAMVAYPRYILKSFMPPLTPYIGFSAETIRKSVKKDVLSEPNIPSPLAAIGSGAFGVKTRPIRPQESAKYKIGKIRREISAIRSDIKRTALWTSPKTKAAKFKKIIRLSEDIAELQRKVSEAPPVPKKLTKAKEAQALRASRELDKAADELNKLVEEIERKSKKSKR